MNWWCSPRFSSELRRSTVLFLVLLGCWVIILFKDPGLVTGTKLLTLSSTFCYRMTWWSWDFIIPSTESRYPEQNQVFSKCHFMGAGFFSLFGSRSALWTWSWWDLVQFCLIRPKDILPEVLWFHMNSDRFQSGFFILCWRLPSSLLWLKQQWMVQFDTDEPWPLSSPLIFICIICFFSLSSVFLLRPCPGKLCGRWTSD